MRRCVPPLCCLLCGCGGSTLGSGGAGAGGAGGSAGASGATGSGGSAVAGASGNSGVGGAGALGGAGGIGATGATGGIGATGGAGATGGTGGDAAVPSMASYTLLVDHIISYAPAELYPEPTLDNSMRLDLSRDPDGWKAIVTPRFGDPAAFAVSTSVDPLTGLSKVVLADGLLRVTSPQLIDEWSTITIDGTPGGALGNFSADGKEQAVSDVPNLHPITGEGRASADVLAPEQRATVTSAHGPGDAFLPWDPIRVTFAEPLAASALEAALGATLGGSTSVNAVPLASWALTPAEPARSWAGVTEAVTFAQSWNLAGKYPVGTFVDLLDPSANVMPPTTTPLSALALPPPQPAHSFDGATITIGTWGAVTHVGTVSGDPRCEQGGCVEIGPDPNGHYLCHSAPTGIAGRLNGGGSQVRIRFRYLTGNDFGGTRPTYIYGTFRVEVATPGAPSTIAGVTIDPSLLTDYVGGPGEESLLFATPWLDQIIDVGGTASEVGFALHLGPESYCGFAGWELPPFTAVIVNRVELI